VLPNGWALSCERRRPSRVAHEAPPPGDSSIRELTRELSRRPPTRIVVEATGGYERDLVEALSRTELPVVVVNPLREILRISGEPIGTRADERAGDAHSGRDAEGPEAPADEKDPQGEKRHP